MISLLSLVSSVRVQYVAQAWNIPVADFVLRSVHAIGATRPYIKAIGLMGSCHLILVRVAPRIGKHIRLQWQ